MLNFPLQLIPENDKNEAWHKLHVDVFIGALGSVNSEMSASKEDEFKNYRTYNSIYEPELKKFITAPNGRYTSMKYEVWPLARQKVRQLVSDFMARPLKKKVSTINKESENRKEKHQLDLALAKVLESVDQELSEVMGFDVSEQEEGQEPGQQKQQQDIPEDIEKHMSFTYRESSEDSLQIGVDYLLYAKKMIESFKYGFIDCMITFKSFYKVSIIDGNPHWRRIDPRNCFYDLPYESEYLDDCQWFVEERWLTSNQIIAEFELNQTEVKILENLGRDGTSSISGWTDVNSGEGLKIKVVSIEWLSKMMKKVKVSPNKHNPKKPFYKNVEDTYEPRKGEGMKTRVVDDLRECTIIGDVITKNFGRVANQVRSVDSPEKVSLSYVGIVGDATTSIQHSLVKELTYLQDFASDILFTIRKVSKKLGKRALVYDTAQIPKQFIAQAKLSKDGVGPLQTVMHHLTEDSLIAINSKDESNRGKAHSFNQFKEINLSPSGDVTELINLLAMVEDLASKVSGVSPQREGQTDQYQTASGNRSSIISSTRKTEVYMKPYDGLIQRVLEKAINLTKIAWKDGKKARFFMGDGSMAVLNALPNISLNDYGFYLNDGGKDLELKEKVDAAAANYLQGTQDPDMILQMIKVFKQETADESEQVLEAGLAKLAQIREAQEKAQQESDQQIAQITEEGKEKDRVIKREETLAKIDIANINAGAKLDVAEIFSEDTRDVTKAKEKSKVFVENSKAEQAKSNFKNAQKR
jgi:hypothetical protein